MNPNLVNHQPIKLTQRQPDGDASNIRKHG